MVKHPDAWLDDWTRTNVLSESRSLSDLGVISRMCLDDGASDGFSQTVLDEASGGDLIAYLREAIVRSAGG